MISQRFLLCGSLILSLWAASTRCAQAEVRVHGLFTDHMVLQRNAVVPVWGWAEEGEEVTVRFRDQVQKTKAKNGQWSVQLRSLRAGGPDTLTISGKNQIVLQDVLVGEVWLASGQSNMEWPMSVTYDATAEIAKTANGSIRLYTVPKLRSQTATNNVPAKWQECGPETVPGFSAVAYYFGRDLQKALGVPVGLIHTSWGGSPAEVWMSDATLRSNPRYQTEILDADAPAQARYQQSLVTWEAEKKAAEDKGEKFTKGRPFGPWRPSELYNGMIAPLIPFAVKGAIWYQGESNAGRAEQYRSLFVDLIKNWRHDWKQKDLAFHLVSLAPFTEIKPQPSDSTWAELREAQWLATKKLSNVGLAVITDVGEERDIHPRKKEPVGARLALAARGITYRENLVFSGPEYRSMKTDGAHVRLKFDHVGKGLIAKGGTLKGFSIAGADHKFVWADAEIQGDTVVVSSPQVEHPVAVRYGWADYPVVNLWNEDGLPAVPFRTDNFPMITAPKKNP